MRPEKYFWLGLSNQKNKDEFVWTNTDSVMFTHWNAEMPGMKTSEPYLDHLLNAAESGITTDISHFFSQQHKVTNRAVLP